MLLKRGKRNKRKKSRNKIDNQFVKKKNLTNPAFRSIFARF